MYCLDDSTTHCSLKALSLKMAPTVGTSGQNTFQGEERRGRASDCPDPALCQLWSHTLKDLLQQLMFSSIGLCLYLCQYHTILIALTL